MESATVKLATLRRKTAAKRTYFENTLRRLHKIDAGLDSEFGVVVAEWEAAMEERVALLTHQIARLDALPPKLEEAERKTYEVATAGEPTAKSKQVTLKKNGRSITRHLTLKDGKWTGWNIPHTTLVVYEGV